MILQHNMNPFSIAFFYCTSLSLGTALYQMWKIVFWLRFTMNQTCTNLWMGKLKFDPWIDSIRGGLRNNGNSIPKCLNITHLGCCLKHSWTKLRHEKMGRSLLEWKIYFSTQKASSRFQLLFIHSNTFQGRR